MASDVALQRDTVSVPVRAHRRRGWLLLALAAFQLWLWITRIVNLLRSPDDVPAPIVHSVLYTAAIGAALVLGGVGLRMLRESRRRTSA